MQKSRATVPKLPRIQGSEDLRLCQVYVRSRMPNPYVMLAIIAHPNMARLRPSALLLLIFLQIWDTLEPR